METLNPSNKALADFVYDYPDLAVKLLNKHGYPIRMSTATLPKINRLIFSAIYLHQDSALAADIDDAIQNEGNSNYVVALVIAAVTLVSSLIGTFEGKSEAKRQRELARNVAMADLAQQEKIQYENIRTQAETDRIKILANTLLDYRTTLQKESTIRLRDTWLYLLGIGVSMGIFYGLFLITSTNKPKPNVV